MRNRNPVLRRSARRRPRAETLVTWALVVLLGWVLVSLVLALARDLWVFVIAFSQP